MLLLIDNYDSFTYNLVQYFAVLGTIPHVIRNDELSLSEIIELSPTQIVISPGPGTPDDAGVSLAVLSHFASKRVPILGVCLGHQCIGQGFGGKVIRTEPVHGKTSLIHHDNSGVFHGIPSPFLATRYHSLAVEEASLPPELVVSARSQEGVVMGLRHRELPIEGVQFHPEAILTESGYALLSNFLAMGSPQ